jgi:hypothetical protein
MIEAVHASKIERAYRFLAVTLAFYADDNGENIFPRADRLAAALGVTESRVRHGLQALVERQVIQYDGFHGHTRRFRFNLDRLACYDGEVQPCCPQQGYDVVPGGTTLLPTAANPASGSLQTCCPQPLTLLPAAGADLRDLPGSSGSNRR